MIGNIDKNGDVLLLTETEFEKGYIQQFNGCMYSAFVKCGNTPADVIGLKLRKTAPSSLSENTLSETLATCNAHSIDRGVRPSNWVRRKRNDILFYVIKLRHDMENSDDLIADVNGWINQLNEVIRRLSDARI